MQRRAASASEVLRSFERSQFLERIGCFRIMLLAGACAASCADRSAAASNGVPPTSGARRPSRFPPTDVSREATPDRRRAPPRSPVHAHPAVLHPERGRAPLAQEVVGMRGQHEEAGFADERAHALLRLLMKAASPAPMPSSISRMSAGSRSTRRRRGGSPCRRIGAHRHVEEAARSLTAPISSIRLRISDFEKPSRRPRRMMLSQAGGVGIHAEGEVEHRATSPSTRRARRSARRCRPSPAAWSTCPRRCGRRGRPACRDRGAGQAVDRPHAHALGSRGLIWPPVAAEMMLFFSERLSR